MLSNRLPPPPNPDAGDSGGNGAPAGPLDLSSLNGVAGAGPQQGQPQAQQQAAPAPTHSQTVVALRHFDALAHQLQAAMKDPDLGKADIKAKVIESMTSMVADRLMMATEAVEQLATFPERPFDQRKWIAGHLANVMAARDAVLSHHGVAYAGQGPGEVPHMDNHISDMAGMMKAHYAPKGGRRA